MLTNRQHTLCYCDNNNDKYDIIYNGGYNNIYIHIVIGKINKYDTNTTTSKHCNCLIIKTIYINICSEP